MKHLISVSIKPAAAHAPNPEAERGLKIRAFLNVDIFKSVLEYYKGSNLPEMKYLGNTLTKEFGLDPETHEEFSRTFRENCQLVGWVEPLRNPSLSASAMCGADKDSFRSGRLAAKDPPERSCDITL